MIIFIEVPQQMELWMGTVKLVWAAKETVEPRESFDQDLTNNSFISNRDTPQIFPWWGVSPRPPTQIFPPDLPNQNPSLSNFALQSRIRANLKAKMLFKFLNGHQVPDSHRLTTTIPPGSHHNSPKNDQSHPKKSPFSATFAPKSGFRKEWSSTY